MYLLSKSILRTSAIIAAVFFFISCEKVGNNIDTPTTVSDARGGASGGKRPNGESAGNNLSFPVIWAEGTSLALRVPPANYTTNDVVLNGAWWYVWGTDPIDPSEPIYSCLPNPSNELTCLDETNPGDGNSEVYKAYLQKDTGNFWQAATITPPTGEVVNVDSIDWGDNLESIDWSLVSQVRTEVVLYKNLTTPVLQYAMRHVSGWGIDEVHGLQTTTGGVVQNGPGTEATIYSRHARLTIQKLFTNPSTLTWSVASHSWTGDVNAPVFSEAVWEAGDGPGFYNAEVNVKGKIIYGYTWNVNKLNDGAGVYRITFSFDGLEAGTTLNTFITGNTGIVLPSEVEILAPEEEGGGGTAALDVNNNLTYIDVTIVARGKGSGSGNGQGGK